MRHKLIRNVLAAGGLLGLMAVMAPPAAFSASTTPQRNITVTITDKGFDKKEYTAGFSGSTADDGAAIMFLNSGTLVHDAETVPGALDMGATFGAATDANGNSLPCFVFLPCQKLGRTNTGGISPGGSVTLGFQVVQAGADYTLTSGPDCLYGNSTPGFDCTPIVIHLVPIATRSPISGTMGGSVIRAAGSKDCDPVQGPVPDPSICFSDVRDPGTIQGSPTKPVKGGAVTVTITDIMFDPTTLYVDDPTTVTWVNKGTMVHSVIQKPFTSGPYNGFDFLGPVGLGPGDTFSYTFHTYAGWRAQKGTSISANVTSFTHNDIVPSGTDIKTIQGCKSPVSKAGAQLGGKGECGQPGMFSKVITVPNANSPN